MTDSPSILRACLCAAFGLAALAPLQAQERAAPSRGGDHIVAVVNQELVTAGEVERRIEALRATAARERQPLPAADALRQAALDGLIEERVVVTHARDAGWRVDEADLDRAVQNVAAQNQLTLDQLRERLALDGLDMVRFRASLRDQIMVERTREREVAARILISDAEIEAEIAAQRAAAQQDAELNIAQILIGVPEGSDAATVAARRERADAALARVRGGEAFAQVAKAMSEDANREAGGEIGLRPASRLPDLFVAAVKELSDGQLAPALLRSGAGFHVLKLIERRDAGEPHVTETRARHILLRISDQATPESAARRLAELRAQIESGARRFEDVAREVSDDGSAPEGGDLGWFGPGAMVPEFEEPMNRLPVGGLSQPVLSRFGVHLILVQGRREVAVDPKQLREQVRNILRERKFQQSFDEWMRELRARAYVEMREPGPR